jgi:3-oxoadipate enol-lactonase / 4-carboxymuconolactone decarboxylase
VTVNLHHVLEGPEHAPVILFASSLGTTHAMWDDQAAALSREFRVLRYDHRGHGGSPVPPGPYTIADLAGDALALLDRLGIERVTFVGLSIGGAVAMTAALRAPERIERLVLCSTAAYFGPPEQWIERAATVRTDGVEAVAPAALERWLTPEAPPQHRDRLEAMLLATPREGYAACAEALGGYDVRGRLGARTMPVLAIAGADDPTTPPDTMQQVVDEIPGARLHVLESARHIANVERADAFNRSLAAFLEPSQTGGSPRSGGESPGMRVRREVLGDAHVDDAIERTTGFTADFQDLITRYAWGEVWTRPGLDRRMRSAITLTALVAGGHGHELAMHVRAARRNGLSDDEIKEVLLQAAIYCGVPAANAAFAIAQRVIDEEAK